MAELQRAYRTRALSPVEVTEAVLARIAQCEPVLNAMYRVSHEQARAQARESEARWRDGVPCSALDGVPVTLKENLYTRGDPAPVGTASSDETPRPDDAPVPARLRAAGCVLLGKTTMPDFGMLSSGRSSRHGTTRNPWDTSRNPAGSSSGAGAAGAAGYGPLHVGTDIGGSIRLPATQCGLFGFKPSHGRVPVDPPYLGRVAGPMTRRVADAVAMMPVIVQPDARDFMSLPPDPAIDWAGSVERRLGDGAAGLRIGVIDEAGAGLPTVRAAHEALREASDALERAGATLVRLRPFLDPAMLDGMNLFFEVRSYRELQALSAERRARVLPFIVEWASWRGRHAGGTDVMAAWEQVVAMQAAATRCAAQVDYLLTPVTPVLAYAAELEAPTGDPHRALEHIAWTVPWNMSGHPAAAVPWGLAVDDGAAAGGGANAGHGTTPGVRLPVGVQLVGPRFDDAGVLALAALLETLRPAQPPWPRVGGDDRTLR